MSLLHPIPLDREFQLINRQKPNNLAQHDKRPSNTALLHRQLYETVFHQAKFQYK
jgi:hypothetical protein